MEDKLADTVHGLIAVHGISDVLLMVLGSFADGNVNNPRITTGDAGTLVVSCGDTTVSVCPGSDAIVQYHEMELSPDDARDLIHGLMVAACLAARERANAGSGV